MAHMCTHLPNDPTLVLALRVTESTYDHYLRLNPKASKTFNYPEGMVLFVPIDSESTWGWMTHEGFDALYEPLEKWSKTRYTTCKARTA